MGAVKVEPVVLDGGLGKQWWEHPNFLWQGRSNVRERRLRATLSRTILPLLQGLEALQRKHYPDAQLLLKGKTLEQIERDPIALEFALFLYELAISKDLILTRQDKKGGLVSVRKLLSVAVGSCGVTSDDVVQRYVRQLAMPILNENGLSAADLRSYVPLHAQKNASSLSRLRTLASLDKALVTEMSLGLEGLDDLAEKDRAWLDVLSTADVSGFLRPLRKVLEGSLDHVMHWPAALLASAIAALDHPSKIISLGRNVEVINDPAIFKALGYWPQGKGRQGERLCRIALIKKQVGEKTFNQLLQGSPGLLKELGTWPTQKIELYRDYLPILTGPVMQIFLPLDEGQRLAMIRGLSDRFGPHMLAAAFKTKEGLSALQGMVNEVTTMNQTAKQDPAKVRSLIAGSYFDDYLNRFYPVV